MVLVWFTNGLGIVPYGFLDRIQRRAATALPAEGGRESPDSTVVRTSVQRVSKRFRDPDLDFMSKEISKEFSKSFLGIYAFQRAQNPYVLQGFWGIGQEMHGFPTFSELFWASGIRPPGPYS